MACTTILVGKKASYDGSTMIARNDDGYFDEKKLIIVDPKNQPKKYKSVISHLEIDLPDNPLRYSACPSVDKKNGIWAACGINECNVGMSATETITSNARVLGADPYVKYVKGKTKDKDVIGGIGEEDLVVLILPYIHSAREGVLRLGELLEKYGTYEPNGIAFNDENEIWWVETIGGHHFIAKRVKDEEYVIMPNQFGLDNFDFDDAFGEGKDNLCSKDLLEFINNNHLDLNNDGVFNPRLAFGSHDDSDHVYNTPRAWYMGRYFNPRTYKWDGDNCDFSPECDDIFWSMVPERKITVEDIKYILSSHYQGTDYDPYSKSSQYKGIYRPIGINRTGVMAINQIRGYMPDKLKSVEWVCFGPNPFNVVIPFYTSVDKFPSFVANTTMDVSTDSFYWLSRLIAALTEASYSQSIQVIERYQKNVLASSHEILNKYDKLIMNNNDFSLLNECNLEICKMAHKNASDTLSIVLKNASINMKCGYNRSDN